MRTSCVGSKGSVRVVQREDQAPQLRVTEEASAAAAPNSRAQGTEKAKDPIIIIDIRLLSRECLARVLSTECDVPVTCFSTIDEWLADERNGRIRRLFGAA